MIRSKFPRVISVIKLLVAAPLIATLVVTSIAPAWGEDQLSISSAPAADGTIDKERSRFSYQVDPGQSINDEYFVQNSGSTPQVVSVYATDAYNSDDGNFALLDTGVPTTDVGSWVRFADGSSRVDLTLQAGESRILNFTVNVPADATPGDHAGGIVVSALTDSGQVKLDRRIATRLYLRVKGELQALMTIGSIDATYDPSWNPFDGTVNLAFTLTNNGNVSLGADTVSRVTGLFGIPFSADNRVEIPELLPGTSRTVSLPISGVGQWLFLTTSVDLVGTIDEDAINPGPMPTAKRDALIFATPWFAIVTVMVSLLLFLFLRSKRRRDAQRAEEWLEFAAAAAAAEAPESKDQAAKKPATAKPVSKKPTATPADRKPSPKRPGK
jgi:hypothetical protein